MLERHRGRVKLAVSTAEVILVVGCVMCIKSEGVKCIKDKVGGLKLLFECAIHRINAQCLRVQRRTVLWKTKCP